MTEITVDKIIHFLEVQNPLSYAESWDNIGLQIGDRRKIVKKIFVALDATDAVIEEAVHNGVDLIITHHPLIFKPLKNVNTDNFIGRRVIKCIKNNISLYSMHTNYDICNMARLSSEYLKLKNTSVLDTTMREKIYKIVIFSSMEMAETISEAMYQAGAMHPFISETSTLENEKMCKVETIVSAGNLEEVKRAFLNIPSHMEPKFDVFEILKDGKEEGIGRIGDLPSEMSVRKLAEYVKKQFNLNTVQVYGDLDKKVVRAAISPGSGKSVIGPAMKKKAQVLITGDIGYNDGIDAAANNLTIIDAGHYELEHIFINHVKETLETEYNQISVLTEVIKSPVQTV